jgi:hypothetical protein
VSADKDQKKILNAIVFLCGSTPNVSRAQKGHAGAGWYAHNAEYPDEGAQFLGREPDDIARLLEVAIAEISRMRADDELEPT